MFVSTFQMCHKLFIVEGDFAWELIFLNAVLVNALYSSCKGQKFILNF